MLGAFGGPGMFLLFAGFAAVSAVLFALGTRMPPPKTAGSAALGVRGKLQPRRPALHFVSKKANQGALKSLIRHRSHFSSP